MGRDTIVVSLPITIMTMHIWTGLEHRNASETLLLTSKTKKVTMTMKPQIISCKITCVCVCLCVEKGLEIGLYEVSVIFVTACLKEKLNWGNG